MASAQRDSYSFGTGNRGVQIGSNSGTVYNHFQGNDNQEDALTYLFLTDPRVDRSNIIAEKGSRVPHTCEWICQEPAYLQWMDSSASSLWLSGGPGKGKTMIALHVTETLLQMEKDDPDNKTVLFFFCSDKSATQNNAIAVLRGLLFQFITKKPQLIKYCVESLTKTNYKQTVSSFGALWDAFALMLKDDSLGDVFCVLDGVDECEKASRTMLLRKLFTLFPKATSNAYPRFKLLGISRDIGGVNFSPDETIKLEFVNSHTTNLDIELFIDNKLAKLEENVVDFDCVKEEVRIMLVKRAEGTFLWIGLLMQELEQSDLETAEEVRDFIANVPGGLDPLYNRLLGDTNSTTRKVLSEHRC